MKKKKLIILSVAVLLVAGVALFSLVPCRGDKEYECSYKKELKKSSLEELEQHLAECNEALALLDSTINVDGTNPEERFEARRAIESIRQKRGWIQTELDKRKEKLR